MPVMVVGADTSIGRAIVRGLWEPDREVRAFVSDPDAAAALKRQGVKVAFGDVSDRGHISSACIRAFSVVFVGEASVDSRERSFATTPAEVIEGWAQAALEAGVARAIWVGIDAPPPTPGIEVGQVDGELAVEEQVALTVLLDEADKIG